MYIIVFVVYVVVYILVNVIIVLLDEIKIELFYILENKLKFIVIFVVYRMLIFSYVLNLFIFYFFYVIYWKEI